MGGPTEGSVQVAPDGSGKKIRNVAMQVLQQDGTLATVYMQVAGIVDLADGTPVDFEQREWRNAMLSQLDRIAGLLEQLATFEGPQTLADDDQRHAETPDDADVLVDDDAAVADS